VGTETTENYFAKTDDDRCVLSSAANACTHAGIQPSIFDLSYIIYRAWTLPGRDDIKVSTRPGLITLTDGISNVCLRMT
jgi:hypothetical protein